MKLVQFSILFILCLTQFSVFGNITTDSSLVSRFRPGAMWFYTGIRPADTGKVRKYDRLIFDVTHSTFNGDVQPFTNKGLSLGLNTSLLFDIPLTKGNTISIGTGISHSVFQQSSVEARCTCRSNIKHHLSDHLTALERLPVQPPPS